MDLHAALQKLCQITSGSEVSAIDYSRCCIIPATTPHQTYAETIAELRIIVEHIKALCNPDELAFFNFYFLWDDVQTDSIKSILHLAKLIVHDNETINSNLAIAAIIVKKFRNPRIRADLVIAKEFNCSDRHARRIIKSNQDKLRTLLNQFINTDYTLAHLIEKLLTTEEIIL